MIRGFDASVVQGLLSPELLAKCKDEGIEYVYLRCGIGNDGKDKDFDENVRRVRAAGLAPAPYHFLYPLPHISPEAQAQMHYEMSGGVGTNVGELPPAIDLEWPPRETRKPDGTLEDTWGKWGCSAKQICDYFLRYARKYHELAGVRPIVYTYPYFCVCLAPLPAEFGDYMLWWASQWNKATPNDGDRPVNTIPGVWQKDILAGNDAARGFFWQHDGNGGLLLPNGVDADFDVFVGTREQFNQLLGTASTDPAPIQVVHPTIDFADTLAASAAGDS